MYQLARHRRAQVYEILDDGKYFNHAKAGHAQNTGDHPDGPSAGDVRTTTRTCTNDNDADRPFLNTRRVPAQGVSSYALRDLAAGEELLDDYSLYDRLPWFEALCAEHGAVSCVAVGGEYT